ncbi:mitochondrial inner membrane protease ATP23 homolog [Contarinia nasturtii]|uniref:mitochondrial inner membrane protease ATP23 homolog n=1 Tax=Contarinia nasturtii TaxID=265458 RepID=UPI0012D480CC|nr:mitochondrial inner membrane protease ATP23 homolog [Contarinia nasturtii]
MTDTSQTKSAQNESTPNESKSGEQKSGQESEWAKRLLKSAFFNTSGENKWGYDLYPERKKNFELSLFKAVTMEQGRESYDKVRCEKNVFFCAQKSPLVKTMMGALRSAGCPFDLTRHISCETCDESVTGGYDPETNQIVICQNTARDRGFVQGILTHEMIHMFDYCLNNLDFKNVEHLACTEIRAANLAHCSFLGAYMQDDADFFNIRKKHQDCVKTKALYSVLAVRRDLSKAEAIKIIEKVFPKCYADLEPIGRRIRSGSADPEHAYAESKYYGYY